MNVCILQPRLSVARRADNLSHLDRMIRQAAEHSHAPDLIVLPDCCVSTQETAHHTEVTVAMCQGFAEAFAWWAREWGIWIAVGHSFRFDHGLREVATLFDPDGDPFIRAFDPVRSVPNDSDPAKGNACPIVAAPWVVRNTPIGRIALCSWNAPTLGSIPPIESKRSPDLIIVPAIDPKAAAISELARQQNSYVVSVGCSFDGESKAQSYAANPDGKVIAEAAPGESIAVSITLDIAANGESDDESWEALEGIG